MAMPEVATARHARALPITLDQRSVCVTMAASTTPRDRASASGIWNCATTSDPPLYSANTLAQIIATQPLTPMRFMMAHTSTTTAR